MPFPSWLQFVQAILEVLVVEDRGEGVHIAHQAAGRVLKCEMVVRKHLALPSTQRFPRVYTENVLRGRAI